MIGHVVGTRFLFEGIREYASTRKRCSLDYEITHFLISTVVFGYLNQDSRSPIRRPSLKTGFEF